MTFSLIAQLPTLAVPWLSRLEDLATRRACSWTCPTPTPCAMARHQWYARMNSRVRVSAGVTYVCHWRAPLKPRLLNRNKYDLSHWHSYTATKLCAHQHVPSRFSHTHLLQRLNRQKHSKNYTYTPVLSGIVDCEHLGQLIRISASDPSTHRHRNPHLCAYQPCLAIKLIPDSSMSLSVRHPHRAGLYHFPISKSLTCFREAVCSAKILRLQSACIKCRSIQSRLLTQISRTFGTQLALSGMDPSPPTCCCCDWSAATWVHDSSAAPTCMPALQSQSIIGVNGGSKRHR